MTVHVAESQGRGLGLFALQRIPVDTIVTGAEYDGLLLCKETARRELQDKRWIRSLSADLCVDGKVVSLLARKDNVPLGVGKGALINVSKTKWNVRLEKRDLDTWTYFKAETLVRRTQRRKLGSTEHFIVVAARDIAENEELFLRGYGPRYDWKATTCI